MTYSNKIKYDTIINIECPVEFKPIVSCGQRKSYMSITKKHIHLL